MPLILIAGAIALYLIYRQGQSATHNPATPAPSSDPGYWESLRGLPSGMLRAVIRAVNPSGIADREGGLALLAPQYAFDINLRLMNGGEKSLWWVSSVELPVSALREPAINLQLASYALAEAYRSANGDVLQAFRYEASNRGVGEAMADAFWRAYK